MKRFTTETVLTVIAWIKSQLQNGAANPVSFEVLNPDAFTNHYAGELTETKWGIQRVRSFQNLVDLAHVCDCHMKTPELIDHWLQVTFVPRDSSNSWHNSSNCHSQGDHDKTEKYGVHSEYQRINKLEDPSFVWDMKRALTEAGIGTCNTLVDLGVNTGDEFDLIQQMNPHTHCTGIDHSASAIENAKTRFIDKPYEFIENDLNQIESMYLKRYDILMSLGTLHSPGVDSKRIFMWCVQNLLSPTGSVIIGFPNCRWVDGQAVYGAKTKNRRESDLSLVIKDIYFIKKYLQQHRFEVTIFGKYYLFVVGTKL